MIINEFNYQVMQKAPDDKVVFSVESNIITNIDPVLKDIFTQFGIQIPPAQQKLYGKRVVFLQDPLFAQAFHDVYWHRHMNKNEYTLIERQINKT